MWIFAPWPQKFLEIFGKKKFRENSTNFAKNLEFFGQYLETKKLIIKKKLEHYNTTLVETEIREASANAKFQSQLKGSVNCGPEVS